MTGNQQKTLDLFSTRILNASDALYDAHLAILRIKSTPDTENSNLIALNAAKQSLKTEIAQFNDFAKTIKESSENLEVVRRYVNSIRSNVL